MCHHQTGDKFYIPSALIILTMQSLTMGQIISIGTEDRANELINFVSEIFVSHHQKYEKNLYFRFFEDSHKCRVLKRNRSRKGSSGT